MVTVMPFISNISPDAECLMSSVTSFIQASVHDAVLDLHVSGEVSLQRELARAVQAFERFAVRVEMHVAH